MFIAFLFKGGMIVSHELSLKQSILKEHHIKNIT